MSGQDIQQQILTGERALFQGRDLRITDTLFADGESPLKESHGIALERSIFKWKYPLWYSHDIQARHCTWFDLARAGVWYSQGVLVEDSLIQAPKNFRRCGDVTLRRVTLTDAAETLWQCRNVTLDEVQARGDYFAMNSRDLTVRGLNLVGGYAFDGLRDAEISDSRLLTKDAFWNSENVTVRDCFISSEYLGWNSRNLTLINCTIESLQGMCYIENLVMKNCTLLNTDLAFEYSTVDVEVNGRIESIKNPRGGIIKADEIGEIILDDPAIDPEATRIIQRSTEDTLPVAG